MHIGVARKFYALSDHNSIPTLHRSHVKHARIYPILSIRENWQTVLRAVGVFQSASKSEGEKSSQETQTEQSLEAKIAMALMNDVVCFEVICRKHPQLAKEWTLSRLFSGRAGPRQTWACLELRRPVGYGMCVVAITCSTPQGKSAPLFVDLWCAGEDYWSGKSLRFPHILSFEL